MNRFIIDGMGLVGISIEAAKDGSLLISEERPQPGNPIPTKEVSLTLRSVGAIDVIALYKAFESSGKVTLTIDSNE
ncbi:MAG: hypothetical protein IPJ02_17535 [Chitinophagaceae bacterium]|nr:hypothetical protein [Chitinophagaceae bacterium]